MRTTDNWWICPTIATIGSVTRRTTSAAGWNAKMMIPANAGWSDMKGRTPGGTQEVWGPASASRKRTRWKSCSFSPIPPLILPHWCLTPPIAVETQRKYSEPRRRSWFLLALPSTCTPTNDRYRLTTTRTAHRKHVPPIYGTFNHRRHVRPIDMHKHQWRGRRCWQCDYLNDDNDEM